MRSCGSTTRGWRVAGLLAAGLAVGALSGCGAPPHPLDSASPASPPTESPAGPTFATPEAAFEAAVATYQRYVDISNQILADGGADPRRLLEVVEDNDFARQEFELFAKLQADGVHVEGAGTFRKPQLVQYQDGANMIQIYACGDVASTRVVDRNGQDVTVSDRDVEVPYLVTFAITPADTVLISNSEPWNGLGVC